jgi:hypothetical protein
MKIASGWVVMVFLTLLFPCVESLSFPFNFLHDLVYVIGEPTLQVDVKMFVFVPLSHYREVCVILFSKRSTCTSDLYFYQVNCIQLAKGL